MTTLKLAAPGSTVRLTVPNMAVCIEDVNIAGPELMVKYYVVFWKDEERKGIWVHAGELDMPDTVVQVELDTKEINDV